MIINLKLDIDNYQSALKNSFYNLNFNSFYNSVGKVLLNAVILNFELEGAYFQRGTSWMPLSQSTIKERERLGFTPISILRRRAGDAGLLGSINYTVSNDGVEIGTNLFYAKYLHFGVPGKMPARAIFPENEFPPEIIEDITELFQKFLSKIMQ